MNLGDRMKANYENRYRTYLTRRTPVIMRLDGKAFHTLTKECERPFDDDLRRSMLSAASSVLQEVQGAQCAYIQSDEISILITDYTNLRTEAWFDYNVQKMVSVAASICSVSFTQAFCKLGHFDCRAFNIPEAEVCNYFVWRQKDWERNSLFMLANSVYSAKELHQKDKADIHDMLYAKGMNWANLPDCWKNGTLIRQIQGVLAPSYPVFTADRNVIERLLIAEEV